MSIITSSFTSDSPSDRRSLTIENQESEQKEQRWNSLPSSAEDVAWRRRTYNGSTASLITGLTSRFSTTSFNTYYTATSYLGSWRTAPSVNWDGPNGKERSIVSRTFRSLLERGGLSLVEEDDDEFNWCGRGMHVEFKPGEAIPLEIYDSAGHGSTATVIHRRRGISQKDLLREAQTLRKLKHAHVVQLVGTYTKGRIFATLIYPVADMDLAQYLDEGRSMSAEADNWTEDPIHERAYQDVLSKGSLCLLSALRYVHKCGVKHMDIKPANILLKRSNPTESFFNNVAYKMYLCDFGISQAFDVEDQSQTETYPGKTPTYASPEVAAGVSHGRASDVFSLGCVIVEMATVYSGLTVESLRVSYLAKRPYHTSLDRVRSWVTTLNDMKVKKEVILKMLEAEPESRPSLLLKEQGKDTIGLECPHAYDPPDSFEADEISTFI
ncbi:Mitogen-activated protein kinase kinase kinase 2 [Clarireedia jacksonii]